MKPVIIAIVGASGCGKTYLAKYLQSKFDIPVIVSTTTRPQRADEIDGKDYFFVRNTKKYNRADMLTYNRFGRYEYFAMRDQLPSSGYCSYVVEENGVKALKGESGKDYHVFVLYIASREHILRERGIAAERIERDRGRKQIDYGLVDVILGNNGTLEEFEQGACDVIKILEQWRHLR